MPVIPQHRVPKPFNSAPCVSGHSPKTSTELAAVGKHPSEDFWALEYRTSSQLPKMIPLTSLCTAPRFLITEIITTIIPQAYIALWSSQSTFTSMNFADSQWPTRMLRADVIVPILQMKKQGFREFKWLAQGWSWDLHPGHRQNLGSSHQTALWSGIRK